MSSVDSLVEIPTENLSALRDKFKIEWPKHIAAYSLLDNLISRFKRNQKSKETVQIYSLNGNWESDATFVAVMRERDILFATLDPQCQKLKSALKQLNFADMKFFMCVRDEYRSAVLDVVRDESLKVIFDDGTVMKYLSKEDAKKFNVEIPENFQLRSLSMENTVKINSVWPHRNPESIKFIEYMIENNTNVGLYDETDELVAWCLKMDFGSLAVLQTDENHFRKGYAAIVVEAICKKIAEECDVDISSNIVHGNVKSFNLFNKLGFEEIDKNHWIGVKRE